MSRWSLLHLVLFAAGSGLVSILSAAGLLTIAWNGALPALFGLPALSFLQAICLVTLVMPVLGVLMVPLTLLRASHPPEPPRPQRVSTTDRTN